MKKRKLIWAEERAFKGLRCDSCGWLIPNPTMHSKAKDKKEFLAEAEAKFADHKCEKYPLQGEAQEVRKGAMQKKK